MNSQDHRREAIWCRVLAASAKGGLETQVAGKENAEVIATSTCILSIGNISEAQNEQKNKSI
jgi:hypothetical protein